LFVGANRDEKDDGKGFARQSTDMMKSKNSSVSCLTAIPCVVIFGKGQTESQKCPTT
jgi:hypothetical protein